LIHSRGGLFFSAGERFSARAFFIAVALAAAALFSCAPSGGGAKNTAYYLKNTGAKKELIRSLFAFLGAARRDEERFSLVREIANQYSALNDHFRLINFLTQWVDDHPDDPYTSYYLLRTADGYIRTGSRPIAALYFDQIVRNYPDLIVRGDSIHLACLKQLINLVDDPRRKIWYYEQLIARFSSRIDLGAAYFLQGKAYERLGQWEEAIAAYKNFMPYYGTNIPGYSDAYSYAKQMIDMNTILKNITGEAARLDRSYPSLSALLSVIRRTLDDGDTYRLWHYRARVNFFARSWSQMGEDEVSDFNLSSLSAAGKIQYADDLSAGSGSNDAYLKTWGWSKFTPIWYFYFRKIYFPLDPQINGRWEWAGVYYGERF
jgi:tetratricopeptide (TPR) repeat protein